MIYTMYMCIYTYTHICTYAYRGDLNYRLDFPPEVVLGGIHKIGSSLTMDHLDEHIAAKQPPEESISGDSSTLNQVGSSIGSLRTRSRPDAPRSESLHSIRESEISPIDSHEHISHSKSVFSSSWSSKKSSPEFFAHISDLISTGQMEQLLAVDQLRSARTRREAFVGFLEPQIAFAPTFKVERQVESSWVSQRLPAYTDRVLWKSSPYLPVTCGGFWSATDMNTSDHKPVAAQLQLHHRPLRPPWWPHVPTKHALSQHRHHISTDVLSAPVHSDALQHLRTWKIQLLTLEGSNLKSSDFLGKSDPFVCFQGDALLRGKTTAVKSQTLNPQWDPSTLPCFHIVAIDVQDLRYERIMVSVLDYDVFDGHDDIGGSVIYLHDYMTEDNELQTGVLTFSLTILSHGLPSGSLEGSFTIQEDKAVPASTFVKQKRKAFAAAPHYWRHAMAKVPGLSCLRPGTAR